MEEGSLRCDANISVRLKGESEFGVKTEIKNMNSFRNVERAIDYEIIRQIELIEDGERIVQQTLLWDADANEAYPMRSKEEAHDYRYFPDPDLLPVIVDEQWKTEIANSLPELPDAKLKRFVSDFLLPVYDSEILTQSKSLSNYYEEVVSVTDEYKIASNWVTGDVLAVLNDKKIEISDFPLSPLNLGRLINLIKSGTISGKIAKEIFPLMLESNSDPEEIVKEKNLIQISDTSEIEAIIQKIIDTNLTQVEEFRSGKEKVFGFFVGQVMKESKGKANPKLVNEILRKMLTS
jgi:aspartyl-tRNA(Asn)/glutamyl-tRNA(Gln) amidotransferase subunit B